MNSRSEPLLPVKELEVFMGVNTQPGCQSDRAVVADAVGFLGTVLQIWAVMVGGINFGRVLCAYSVFWWRGGVLSRENARV